MVERWGKNICGRKDNYSPLQCMSRVFSIVCFEILKNVIFPVFIRGVARGGWGWSATPGHVWLTVGW